MSSHVVKKLQNLHIKERSGGLEDLVCSLGPNVDGNAANKTPVRQPQTLGNDLTESSIILKREKAKVADNEKYYYRSPCPEKENLKNDARSPAKIPGLRSSLLDSVAQFVQHGTDGGSSCEVYVGNISYRIRGRELREFFESFGSVVRASVCKDKRTKKSRGFGFVEFSTREEAEDAVNAPENMLTYDGRLLKVRWAERQRKGKSQKQIQTSTRVALEVLAKSYLEKKGCDDISSVEDSEEESQLECLFDKLSNDQLLRVFSYLELKERIIIERVCWRWYNISRQTWRSLKSLGFKGMFTSFQGTGGLTDTIFLSILKRGCENLHELDLSGSPYLLTSFGLHNIAKLCNALKVLNLSNVAVSNQNLKEIGSKCKDIETLILGGCKDFGEKGLWWFLKEAKNLKRLEVSDNVRVTGKSLWMLPSTCQILNFNSCMKLSDDGLDNICKRAVNLLSLDISNCLLVSDVGLTNICHSNNLLRKLVLSEAGKLVTDEGLMAVGQLTHLEFLNLSRNDSVDDDVLGQIVSHCTKLRFLNIEACHGSITETGIKVLSNLELLEDLNISYLAEVTDGCLEHLAANSPLRSLTCKACPGVTNEGLLALLIFGGGSLVCIDVCGCCAIDDVILNDTRLTERDEHLQRIQINVGGTTMTLDGVQALQEKIGNCHVLYEKRYNNRLRKDFDQMAMTPFYPSDDEDDSIEEEESLYPSIFNKGYASSELYDSSSEHHKISHDEAEDFLEADEPAFLDELEQQFVFE